MSKRTEQPSTAQRRSSAASSRRAGHPHEGVDEIVVGRDDVEVDPGPRRRVPDGLVLFASAAADSRRRSSGSLESTSSCSPVSASWTYSSPASGSSYSRGSTMPDGDDLVALGEAQQRPLPSRLADEVRDQHDERAPAHDPRRRVEQHGEVGRRPPLHRRRSSLEQGEHLVAALAGRDRPLAGRRRRRWRRPGCRRARAAGRSVTASSASTRSFVRSAAPNAIDRERSSSSHAVSSRSSMNSRTNSSSMRAVTFQSMWRTSSPHS